jgi:Domain of unknown function (DUF4124)
MKLRYLLMLLCVGQAGWAQAEIYKYVDPEGHVTYTSTPIKGAKKLNLDSPGTSSAQIRSGSETHPSDFPRVDGKTQKSRDNTRREILEDELAAENKLLAEARQNLKDGESHRDMPKYNEKIKALQKQVTLHENNVEALNTELSDLK